MPFALMCTFPATTISDLEALLLYRKSAGGLEALRHTQYAHSQVRGSVTLWRSRYAFVLVLLPHTVIEHQRLDLFFEWS